MLLYIENVGVAWGRDYASTHAVTHTHNIISQSTEVKLDEYEAV